MAARFGTISAAFRPITIDGAFVFLDVSAGMIGVCCAQSSRPI